MKIQYTVIKNKYAIGYITIKGGHRIGITGNVVMENEKVINIRNISSLNFRIAREKKGCSINLFRYVIDLENNNIFNTLIASPPGCGKTTILRDLIKNVSDGIDEINYKGKTVGVVDERGEIAAMYKGIPQNDIGKRTDILDSISKHEGMRMLVRTMAPDIITCDEIGSKEDIEAINYAMCSGTKGIFTAHAANIRDLQISTTMSELIKNNILERIIFLDKREKGKIESVYILDKHKQEYVEVL